MSIYTDTIIFVQKDVKPLCDFCKIHTHSIRNGIWSETLSVEAYQGLLDRGWHRIANYCFKPSMDKTCCPQYAIRCEALQFELSKSQKKIIKKITRFLKIDTSLVDIEQDKKEPLMKHELEEDNMVGSVNVNYFETSKETRKVKPGNGANPNLPRCEKKKILRMEKKLAKNPNFVKTSSVQQKSLENLLAEGDSISTGGIQLSVRIVRIYSQQYFNTIDEEAILFERYQTVVHNDNPDDCDVEQFHNVFLSTCLEFQEVDHPDHPGYGTFHQQYWLGNKLIAVGIIDILPKCVSSVYFFYDPDYSDLVLGIYSSLREISLVRRLNSISPDMKYYYMGFYVHSYPKMTYKAKFQPTYLLCPFRYTWHSVDQCIRKINIVKYSIFDESENINDDDNTFSIDDIPVCYRNTVMSYSAYKTMQTVENEDYWLAEYVSLVGITLARRMIILFLH